RPPSAEGVAANMSRLGAVGLDVHVTEMDVRIEGAPSPAQLDIQAQVYRDALDVCLQARSCTAFVLWGFTDRYSWIPQAFPGFGAALMLDSTYAPKPAYHALLEALRR